MAAHLDLQPYPAAGAAVLVDDDVEVLRHSALHAPVSDVDAPKTHRRHLVECQRLHAQGLFKSSSDPTSACQPICLWAGG